MIPALLQQVSMLALALNMAGISQGPSAALVTCTIPQHFNLTLHSKENAWLVTAVEKY